MKKKIILVALFLTTVASAQFTVTSHEGETFEDNQEFAYNTTEYPTASLGFYVNNTQTNAISMKIELESATNDDGTGMELCFGSCYNNITVGESYPSTPVTIQAGQNQGSTGDHIFLTNANGETLREFMFKFYQVDGFGNEIGTPFRLKYTYNSNLSTNEVALDSSVRIENTIVKDFLSVVTQNSAKMSLYTIDGKMVGNYSLDSGDNKISLEGMKKGVYFAVIQSRDGQMLQQKIMIK